MRPSSQESIAFYDREALSYDQKRWRTAAGRYVDETQRGIVRALVGSCAGRTALDVATGTGRFAIELARLGATRHLAGQLSRTVYLGLMRHQHRASLSPNVAAQRRRVHVIVIGRVPPPCSDRTMVTARIFEELRRAGAAVGLVNMAFGITGSPLRRKLRRSMLLALRTFPILRQTRQASTAYIPVDASPGTIYTVLYALSARLVGTRIVLHHHSYSYLEQRSIAMRCLCQVAGPDTLHVTPSAAISAELRASYPGVHRTADLGNSFAIDPGLAVVRRLPGRDRLVLGHLSNLSVAEGTPTAIACFAELFDRGEPVELHLAGPIQDDASAREIRRARARFGDAFRYHGPVDAAAKREFFSAIDVFVFPTTFTNEVQPLVILESLAAGVPAIAYGRACIPALLEGGAGVIAPGEDFRAAAVRQIVAWRQDPDALQAASKAARLRFAQLQELSRVELATLLQTFKSEPDLVGSGRPRKPVASVPSSIDRPADPYGLPASRPSILFVGPLPPPVTGRPVVTKRLLAALERDGVHVVLANTAPRGRAMGLFRGSGRICRLIAALYKPAQAKWRGAASAYIPVDAGPAMYHNILVTALARSLGLRICLHHHVYSYIRVPKFRMSLLARVAGERANHIVLSDGMAQTLMRRYPHVRQTMVISNFGFVDAVHRPREPRPHDRLRIGHMSNLTIEKGLGRVRATAQALAERGVAHEVVLAGPLMTPAARQTLQTWPKFAHSTVRYLGPVYGPQKTAFFDAIDVFLFPSLYDNEAAPLVCAEAMAAGVPVIAFDIGCVKELLGDSGIALAPEEDFAVGACAVLTRWSEDAELREGYAARARQRYRAGREAGERQLQKLIDCLLRPSGAAAAAGAQGGEHVV